MDEKKIVDINAPEQTNVEDVENLIVIDDGRIDVPIKNQFGEQTGLFRFNPTDLQMVNRYNEASSKFAEIVKPLVDLDISPDGTAETESAMAALNEAEDRLIELFDYVLDSDSREAFFKKTHAFTPTDGTFYCGKVFDAIGAFIAKKFDAETKRVDLRLQKHVHGYRTGKHWKGDR